MFVHGLLELRQGPGTHSVHPRQPPPAQADRLLKRLHAGVGEGPTGGSRNPGWKRGAAWLNRFWRHEECLPIGGDCFGWWCLVLPVEVHGSAKG